MTNSTHLRPSSFGSVRTVKLARGKLIVSRDPYVEHDFDENKFEPFVSSAAWALTLGLMFPEEYVLEPALRFSLRLKENPDEFRALFPDTIADSISDYLKQSLTLIKDGSLSLALWHFYWREMFRLPSYVQPTSSYEHDCIRSFIAIPTVSPSNPSWDEVAADQIKLDPMYVNAAIRYSGEALAGRPNPIKEILLNLLDKHIPL